MGCFSKFHDLCFISSFIRHWTLSQRWPSKKFVAWILHPPLPLLNNPPAYCACLPKWQRKMVSKKEITQKNDPDQTWADVASLRLQSWRKSFIYYTKLHYVTYVVVVALIYPPVTEEHQKLTIGRSAHVSLLWLLRAWRNPHMLRSF